MFGISIRGWLCDGHFGVLPKLAYDAWLGRQNYVPPVHVPWWRR